MCLYNTFRGEMKGLIYFVITISMFCSSAITAQRNKTEEHKKKEDTEELAEIYLQEGKFEKALLIYRNSLDNNAKSPRLNFFVGYCYLNTDYGLEQAIEYLKNATTLTPDKDDESSPVEAYYYLAKAYHLNNQFQLSIDIIDKLLGKIPQNDKPFINQANRLKEFCENALMLSQTKAGINVDNIFEFNSKYSDINPLIFNNGQEAIFSSRREIHQLRKKMDDDQFDENIYYTKILDDEWITPYGLSKSINTIDHESACWISENGKQLIISRMTEDKINLYFSNKNEQGEWSVPEKFPEPINGHSQQTFGSLSSDGKYLYFTSDRKGGYGGTDIYVSENKGNNIWGTPKNLGPSVNTSYNEESPFMHENGVLFFCSEGHISMGGFDMFATYQDNAGNWMNPVNLGLPLNSVEDDFFYQPLPGGQYAFSSSERKGAKGKSDIYRFIISDSTDRGYALISGNIMFPPKIAAEKTIGIKFKNNQTAEEIGPFRTDKNGNYSFILPAQSNYQMSFLYQNKLFYSVIINIPKSYSFLCMDQSIIIPNLKLELDNNLQAVNQTISNNEKINIIYSVNKSTERIKLATTIASVENNYSDSTFLSDLNKSNGNINNDDNKKDSIFSIKLVSSKSRIPLSTFSDSGKVKEHIDSKGNYIYYIGEFDYEWEALIQLRSIKEKYPKATIFVNSFTSDLSN